MLRILTYNIHKAIGNDRKYSLNRIIEILKKSQADIICLQEVDYLVPRSYNEDLALIIAENLHYHYELGLNVYLKKGAYGNAILSRFPITHSENLNITWGIKKRRGCLMTRIIVPESLLFSDLLYNDFRSYFLQKYKKKVLKTKEIAIINMHLGLANFERIWQVKQILNSAFLYLMDNFPIVLAGDTNDRSEKIDAIFEQKGFMDSSKVFSKYLKKHKKSMFYTFPSYAPTPLIRIDKIFVNNFWKVHNHTVIKNEITKIASDHLPVYVDLQLK